MTTHTIIAPLDWTTVDMASDLHLQASTAHTVAAWHHYLAHAECDALFILGDFFELWVGAWVVCVRAWVVFVLTSYH